MSMDGQPRVVRHESELGSWELTLRQPDPRLRALVGEYEGYVETAGRQDRWFASTSHDLASGHRQLRLALGGARLYGWLTSRRDSFFAGLHQRSSYVGGIRVGSCLQMNLAPLGACAFLGLPMHEHVDGIVPLEEVLPRPYRTSTPGFPTPRPRKAVRELDAVLLASFGRAREPSATSPRRGRRSPPRPAVFPSGRSATCSAGAAGNSPPGSASKSAPTEDHRAHLSASIVPSTAPGRRTAVRRVAFDPGPTTAHLNRDFRGSLGRHPRSRVASCRRRIVASSVTFVQRRDGGALGWTVTEMCRHSRLISPSPCEHRRRSRRGFDRG